MNEGGAHTTSSHDLPLITMISLFMPPRKVLAESLLTLGKEQEELSPEMFLYFMAALDPT